MIMILLILEVVVVLVLVLGMLTSVLEKYISEKYIGIYLNIFA